MFNKIIFPVLFCLLIPGFSHASAAWTDKVKIERVSVTPGSNAVYLVVSGHDNFDKYCVSGTTKFLRLDATTDQNSLAYGLALSLYTTGSEARIYVDDEGAGKCSIIVVQSCDNSGGNCNKF